MRFQIDIDDHQHVIIDKKEKVVEFYSPHYPFKVTVELLELIQNVIYAKVDPRSWKGVELLP